MTRHELCLLVVVVLLAAAAPAVHAAALASVLSLVSPPDYQGSGAGLSQVAVDATGRVMVCYKAVGPDKKVKPYSALKTGGAWQHAAIPMPTLLNYPEMLALKGLVGGSASEGFHLVGTHYGKLFYWHWLGGSWSPPELLPDTVTSAPAQGLALDAQGRPLVVTSSTRFAVLRKEGSQWQWVKLMAHEIAQEPLQPVYSAGAGDLHLFGVRSGVPLVVSLPSGADPLVAESWVADPTGSLLPYTSAVPPAPTEDKYVLDWPHQTIYAAWQKSKHLYLAWCPVGATSAGQWQTVEIPTPDKVNTIHQRLVSNGRGGVGMLVYYHANAVPQLTFHWLSPSGPSAAIPVLRPGTQTEASVYTSIIGEGVACAIDDQGTAHLAIVGAKRGEVPAGFQRLYYATVTGGGTATTGPEVTGSGTTEMEREGPPPDFVVTLIKPEAGADWLHVSGNSRWVSERLEPRIEVLNQGAQYFGDLWVEVNLDGALVRVRIADESNHTKPLFIRGQKRTLYLPEAQYQYQYPENLPAPPTLTFDYGHTQPYLKLYTGLGRKLMTVRVDPDNLIEEADEDNNNAQVKYVVGDGSNVADRERVPPNPTVLGLNDLAIEPGMRLRSNTPLLRAGYVQRPTVLEMVISNPHGAGFFLDIPVVVYFDGQEISRQTLPPLGREANLDSRYLGPNLMYNAGAYQPDLSGAQSPFTIDLTQFAVGQHTIKVVVDPDDRFADRHRENNEATFSFRLREPGGNLRVRVEDFTAPHPPIASAIVVLEGLYGAWTDAQGMLSIPDVPAGDYDATRLSAERRNQEPRFFPGYAPAFHVTKLQDNDVTIRLEKPMTVVGTITRASDGQPLTDEWPEVLIGDEDLFVGGQVEGSSYTIYNVPPGQHTLMAGAYGYQTQTLTLQAQRTGDQTDECRANLSLQDGPRCTLTGQVQDDTGRALPGAVAWLVGAPRSAATDASGNYRLERIAGGPSGQVMADMEDHAAAGVDSPERAADQTYTLAPIQLPRIQEKFASIDFNTTTLAIAEETADTGATPAFRVDTKFGAFSGALGLMYHTVGTSPIMTADQLLLWVEGGTFIEGGVSSTVGLDDLFGASVSGLTAVPGLGSVIKGVQMGFTAIGKLNTLADWLKTKLDPSTMKRNHQLTATFLSQTGAEDTQDPLIDIPTEIPVAMTFAGGGQTVVRIDRIELSDALGNSKTVIAEWYSPGFVVYNVGQEFDLNTLTVNFYLAALNDRLSSGVLGTASNNLMVWKPGQRDWLTISEFQYQGNYENY